MVQILHISDLHLTTPGSLGDWLGWLFGNLPRRLNFYSFADPIIKTRLPAQLSAIANGKPTVLALTGDIATWPGDSPTAIDQEHYPYLRSLLGVLPLGSVLLPILGNHDWGDSIPFYGITNFQNTQFQTDYQVVYPRVYVHQGDVTVIFFLIDSNMEMIPATGEVLLETKDFLRESFREGKAGNLDSLSGEEYDDAVKILLLHHSVLPQPAYAGALSRLQYQLLALDDIHDLLQVCKDDIDAFLFGHTHVCTAQALEEGFVAMDAGTTLATTAVSVPPTLSLQVLQIPDRNSIEVASYTLTRQGMFSSHGSKAVSFRRGQAPGGVLARGRWA